jgi:hypothetical protein
VRRCDEAWGEAADTAHRLMSKRGVTQLMSKRGVTQLMSKRGVTQRCGSVLTSNDSAATQACVVRSSRGTNRWATRWERAREWHAPVLVALARAAHLTCGSTPAVPAANQVHRLSDMLQLAAAE